MASISEISTEIEALTLHCRPSVMSAEERAQWLAAWFEDLRQFNAEAIGAACRQWRQSSSTKFPTPGQLLPMVRSAAGEGHESGGKAEAWRPLTDAEFARLSLDEKIRHHDILAHEAETMAGPMWAGGEHGRRLTVAEMPPRWHECMARAKAHRAEARRLREAKGRAVERRVDVGRHPLRDLIARDKAA